MRRTKIIATIGPATENLETLKQIILAGVNVVRINMSHGTAIEREQWIKNTKQIAKELNREIGLLIDLQGPKLRIAKFKENKINLNTGNRFILDTDLNEHAGTKDAVGIYYKNLPKELKTKDVLLLDDGRLVLQVELIQDNQIHCIVQTGGELSNNKGINLKGGGLSANAITEKDKEDILIAAKYNADYVAVSFTKTANDILQVRELLKQAGHNAYIIAKIERTEAINALDDIIKAADAVMVARGDLGVEIGFAELPALQKRIIAKALELDRIVITATQMMESMINNPIPTRAEVSDIANAVLEGTDAVMLSAETATGKYPLEAVQNMAQICVSAEKQKSTQISQLRIKSKIKRTDEAIAMATMYTANHLDVTAIIALTESGSTPLWMSRVSSGIPIYGVSRNKHALGRMTLYRDVYPIEFDVTRFKYWEAVREVLTTLKKRGILNVNDRVIITRGDILGVEGRTNSMKIVSI